MIQIRMRHISITWLHFLIIWSVQTDHITTNFSKAAFHKFHLVYSWILCPNYSITFKGINPLSGIYWRVRITRILQTSSESPCDSTMQKQVFLKISHEKNHVLEFLFLLTLQVFRPATLLKKNYNTGVSLWKFWNF